MITKKSFRLSSTKNYNYNEFIFEVPQIGTSKIYGYNRATGVWGKVEFPEFDYESNFPTSKKEAINIIYDMLPRYIADLLGTEYYRIQFWDISFLEKKFNWAFLDEDYAEYYEFKYGIYNYELIGDFNNGEPFGIADNITREEMEEIIKYMIRYIDFKIV